MRSSSGTVEARGHIAELSRILEGKEEAFLQILLSLCKDATYNRILCCPRFPVRTVTHDLQMRLQLLLNGLSENRFEIPSVLASLFDSVVTRDNKKTHGQYFTPSSVAREAVKLLSVKSGDIILDAGSGTGIFAAAILENMHERNENPANTKYLGIENDPILVLSTAASLDWIGAPNSWSVLYADYFNVDTSYLESKCFLPNVIVSNPPFVRSHRLGERSKLRKSFGLSGYSGLHSFFLVHSSRLLKEGKMVFVLPLEMDETRYGSALLRDLKDSFRIEEKGICFDKELGWVVTEKIQVTLQDRVSQNLMARLAKFESLPRRKEDDISSSLTQHRARVKPTLGSIADVHRGISTGANSFFVMTEEKAKTLHFPRDYLKRILPPKIPRNELQEVFGLCHWREFRDQGRTCWLFYVEPSRTFEKLPSEVREYIRMGERSGIKTIYTCTRRTPWYSVGLPHVPDLVFTYMARENPKFVFNQARALNLTNFIGIFLRHEHRSPCNMSGLVRKLNLEIAEWIQRDSVGRRYAGGLINIGPGDLSRMPISESIFEELGIRSLDP